MSQVTLCDICGERTGLARASLVVASRIHPHKMDPIHERGQSIDVCTSCLPTVPHLTTDLTLEDLQHAARARRTEEKEPPTAPPAKEKGIVEYWVENYVNRALNLCTLCGNTGIIDTRRSAVSPAGIHSGRRNYCICPNGQARREAKA